MIRYAAPMLELLGRRLRAAASAARCFSRDAASRATQSRPKWDSNRASAWHTATDPGNQSHNLPAKTVVSAITLLEVSQLADGIVTPAEAVCQSKMKRHAIG